MSQAHRGSYQYWKDGQRQGIDEPSVWTPYQIQARRRVGGRTALSVTADYAGGCCTGLVLHTGDDGTEASVRYHIARGRLDWQRDSEPAGQALALPADALLFPLMRAGSGWLIRQLAGGARPVVVPDIRPDATPAERLAPIISTRSVQLLETTPDGGTRWRVFGGEYGQAGCEAWLDADDRMSRYVWDAPDGRWEVRLLADR